MRRVRPGGAETFARAFWDARRLRRVDLPTFERPMRANSGSDGGGQDPMSGELVTKEVAGSFAGISGFPIDEPGFAPFAGRGVTVAGEVDHKSFRALGFLAPEDLGEEEAGGGEPAVGSFFEGGEGGWHLSAPEGGDVGFHSRKVGDESRIDGGVVAVFFVVNRPFFHRGAGLVFCVLRHFVQCPELGGGGGQGVLVVLLGEGQGGGRRGMGGDCFDGAPAEPADKGGGGEGGDG